MHAQIVLAAGNPHADQWTDQGRIVFKAEQAFLQVACLAEQGADGAIVSGEKALAVTKRQFRIRTQLAGVMNQLQIILWAQAGFPAHQRVGEQAGVAEQAMGVDALVLNQINQRGRHMVRRNKGAVGQVAFHPQAA